MAAPATLTVEPLAGALHLRLDVPERDAHEPLQEEFRHPLDDGTLRALQESAEALLAGGERARFVADARACGAMLYRTLVPARLRPVLRAHRGPLLVRTSLAGVPWELLHDDEEFWGVRYALGRRLVLARPVAARPVPRRGERPRALVVGADPRGDLPFVGPELEVVCDALEERADVECLGGGLATFERVTAALGRGFDLVHFCGHVVADGRGEPALLLGDGRTLAAGVVESNLAGRPLVFLNGCASARGGASGGSGAWEPRVASVAHGFLVGGALGVVGTLADVSDRHAATLAGRFYARALAHVPVGESLRAARESLRDDAAASASPTWLSFVLYGNPAARVAAPDVVPPAVAAPAAVAPEPAARPRRRAWALVAVATLVVLALVTTLGRRIVPGTAAPVVVGVMEVRARDDNVPAWMRTLTRDALNTVLARVPGLQVYSRQKIDLVREKRGLTELEAAEALGMTKMLSATVGVDGKQVTLDLEVVGVGSGMLEASERVQGPVDALLDLQTQLALRALAPLGVRPSEEELRTLVAERRDATVEAYRLLSETLGGGARQLPPDVPPGPPPTSHGPGTSWLDWDVPAYAQTPDSEERAIRALVDRYAAAIQSKQVDTLAGLQTDMLPAQRASLGRYFAIANDLRVTVRDVDVLVEGTDAVATFMREDAFTDAPSGRSMHLEVRISARLTKQDGTWKIQRLGD
jgi:ketosteroid isomerase-like protein/TolB-like protein